MELIAMSLVTNEVNGVEAVEILNTETHELVKIPPYKLLVGIELNNAPVVNVTTALNSVTVHINGGSYRIPVRLSDNIKQMIRAKREEDRKKRIRDRGKAANSDEVKNKDGIRREIEAYRAREAERKRKAKELSKGFAKPGELTEEERRRRRQEYFRKKADANKVDNK